MENTRGDDLRGTTLKVYKFIISHRNNPVRITDIQTGLGFSSPSLAYYHVKKLVELGLVRDEGIGYAVDKVVIQNSLLVRGILVPFQLAYASFFAVTLATMLTIIITTNHLIINSIIFLALVVNAAALLISVFELRRAGRGVL